MQEKPNVEELITDSMILLLIRAQKLGKRERLAIAQEFREQLNGSCKVDNILILDTELNSNNYTKLIIINIAIINMQQVIHWKSTIKPVTIKNPFRNNREEVFL